MLRGQGALNGFPTGTRNYFPLVTANSASNNVQRETAEQTEAQKLGGAGVGLGFFFTVNVSPHVRQVLVFSSLQIKSLHAKSFRFFKI